MSVRWRCPACGPWCTPTKRGCPRTPSRPATRRSGRPPRRLRPSTPASRYCWPASPARSRRRTCSSGCSGRRHCSSRSRPPTRNCTPLTSTCASAGCARGCGHGSTCGVSSPPGSTVLAPLMPMEVSRKMTDFRETAAAPGAAAARAEAAARLTRLGEEFFEVVHSTDPLNATQLGVTGFDALVPDPSRAGAARGAERIAAIERRLGGIDAGLLGEAGRTDHAVLAHLAWGARADLEHGLWEANASAAGYVSPQAMVFQSVPAALLGDAAAVDGYLQRLGGLSGYFDAVTGRYREAQRDGRLPAEAGARQAAAQLAGHLGKDIGADTLVAVTLPADVDEAAVRREAGRIVAEEVRPAIRRLLACLRDELLPAARPDAEAGIRF